MKVLLGGEYSRLHNSLKEGLRALGVDAFILSTGDDFKRYPADYSVRPRWLASPAMRWFRYGVHRLTKYDMARWETAWRLYRMLRRTGSYDVLQWINPYPFETPLPVEKYLMKQYMQKAGKVFLLACGDDAHTNTFYSEHPEPYNIFTPFRDNPALRKYFSYSLKYLRPSFVRWQRELESRLSGIIPVDLDYAIPYRNHPKALPMIPNPVNTDAISYQWTSPGRQVVIFHGINKGNYWRKGNKWFSTSLEKIKRKYGDKVKIVETTDLPYAEYIRRMREAHIVLDQVYSWDQGYNALEAMAMGKIVFTGAEKVFYEHYGLTAPVNINALPDTDYLVDKMSALIENPGLMEQISQAARTFVEKEHHYIHIAERYLKTWQEA